MDSFLDLNSTICRFCLRQQNNFRDFCCIQISTEMYKITLYLNKEIEGRKGVKVCSKKCKPRKPTLNKAKVD